MAPFPPALKPAARSAYRAMLRSARVTFQGDPSRHVQMITAVRQTFASPTLTPPQSASSSTSAPAQLVAEDIGEEEISKRIGEWQEAARFLRSNVVQGVQDDKGNWKLRVTDDTELGDNKSIKNPPKLPDTPFPNRNRNRNRRKCGDAAPAAEAQAQA